jgi:hypothetical protein
MRAAILAAPPPTDLSPIIGTENVTKYISNPHPWFNKTFSHVRLQVTSVLAAKLPRALLQASASAAAHWLAVADAPFSLKTRGRSRSYQAI